MKVEYQRCCGIDVHQASFTACVSIKTESESRKEKRQYGTNTADILAFADWLHELGVTHAAMEATGVYWKPLWNLLEGQFQMLLVNPQHVKAIPGRKTDLKDGERIANLLQHGLLRGSFVPPLPIRQLRDLTRSRAVLAQERVRIANRLQKVLEDANVKVASVASDVLAGVYSKAEQCSGNALILGEFTWADGYYRRGVLRRLSSPSASARLCWTRVCFDKTVATRGGPFAPCGG